ncbi:hypothetical protein P3875_01160 [Myroides sp. JBRI-B21084]|uniref:hypothetical protein n=1 Tax=Myroides sp. JBRI-B21084 TaxID=3119977 RepID=UPI0026E210A4|nr:hypothetical protein [Paenimyroides cloacae]WKW46710.1 hypothetical protein P3875_01160 [Paenimyroides cloacae]
MKLSIYLILVYIIFGSMTIDNGLYVYRASHFYESIELNNNEFTYKLNFHFSSYETKGTYKISNDSLILNSFQNTDIFDVDEKRNIKKNKLFFKVSRYDKTFFSYDLHLILDDNKEIVLKDQWDTTKIKRCDIKAFYITNKNSFRSPTHSIKDKNSNVFSIKSTGRRVFINEVWLIKGNSIIPRSQNGIIQTYLLEKSE